MYEPCYTSSQGLVGFRCRVGACRKVVPTYRGIVMHCKRVHGLVAQMEMFDTYKENELAKEASAVQDSVHAEPVRAVTVREVRSFDFDASKLSASED